MRHKFGIVALMLILVVAMGCGLYCKSTYKDLNDEENVLDKFVVGRIEDELLERQIEIMNKKLKDSKIVIAAECEDTFTYRFSCATQKVKVVSVFNGQELKVGDVIEVARNSNVISMDEEFLIYGKYSINLGFVNEMIPGKTYLIFLDRKLNTQDEKQIYVQSNEYILAPIFCYENIVNDVPEWDGGEGTYIHYDMVKDNEFFIMSKESDEKLQGLKAKLLEEYKY